MAEPNLTPLSPEEIGKLEGQYDRIRALLASIDVALAENGIDLGVALAEYGAARIRLEQLKQEKGTLVERARNLKALLAGF